MAHLAGVCPSGKHRAYNANSSSFQKIFAKANLFWNGVGLPSSLAQAPRLSRDSCPNDELIVKREVSAAQYGVALAFCLGHLRHSKLPAANPRAPSSECGASGGCLPEGQTPRLQRQFLLFPKNLCLSKSFLEGGRVLGSLRRLRRRKGSRKSRVGEFCGIKKCRGLPFRQAPAFHIQRINIYSAQYIPSMPPPAGAGAAGGVGISVTMDSVVRSVEATEAAFWSTERVTLVGSMMPLSSISV